MSKNPWFPLAVCLLFGAAGYVLIVTVGCGVIRTAADHADRAAEETPIRAEISKLPGWVTSEDEVKDDADGFRFPDDRGGQLLSQLLPPSEKTASPAAHDAPAARRLPPADLDTPSPPLPPGQAEMPRLPAANAPSLRPRPLPEELPLIGHQTDPLALRVQYRHTGDRVRLPSVDVNQPIPLPVLAKPVTDRASLDDATSDASLAAALAATLPTRTTPAPFLKLSLPDPFENRLKPPAVPPEEVAPTYTGSRPAR